MSKASKKVEEVVNVDEKFSTIRIENCVFIMQVCCCCTCNQTPTPTGIKFKEITMNLPDPGNTLVYTGTLTPAGSALPAGTTPTITSDNPLAVASLDPTGLIVTVVLDPTITVGTAVTLAWDSGTFTPVGSTVNQFTQTISFTVGAPPPPTPTGITFTQTT